ncbi:MAG: sulfur carrier protein ThiS [Roseibium sp.]|uniref:sulfur carrier protein ThiS n=1 Tax=Roseibium sp. TaxID=1936156 RepID=UPI001AFD621F|nr:sulfur carrier protein ThiS [Roseibium sp.]MBO6508047.1 sulfur carrier protein ThiS [Roseibium sp.]MBO6891262.1 sulfur carrier protein ThiS [Roseibium sp.]MBO6932045.1 sulfur carrier protein ThiS [Roseibium sp.]
MKLIINGERQDVSSLTLDALLEELAYDHEFLATARNNELVAAEDRTRCRLAEGDRIEILSPMQGG